MSLPTGPNSNSRSDSTGIVSINKADANKKAKWFLLANPVSGNGRGGRKLKELLPALEQSGLLAAHACSDYAGHMPKLTAEVIAQGYRRLIVLGGDGTANEVVNGIMTQDKVPSSDITLTAGGVGTGNDWMKTLILKDDVKGIIDRLQNGRVVEHDVGLVSWGSGFCEKRFFINIAGAGFDGDVTRQVAENKSWLAGSKLAYWKSILISLFRYRRTQLRILPDASEEQQSIPQGDGFEQESLTLAVGICKYNGGGMMQCPQADYNDGLLDITVIGKMSTAGMVRRLPMMLDGSHVALDAVRQWRAKSILIESEPEIWHEVDGEILGKSPLKVSCIPSALRIQLGPF